MADGRGAKSVAAIIKATTWGTPVQCGAGEGLLIDSSSIVGGKEVIPDRSLTGNVFGNAPVVGQEMHRGSISGALRYGANCEKLLAGWMGVAANATEVEATYEYTHLLTIEEVLGDIWTYVELKGDIAAWEYETIKISRVEIEITGRGPAQMTVEFVASKCVTNDGGTNTISTMGSVTVPTPITPAYLGDCRVRINAQGGGALGSGDVVKPNLVRIVMDRKLSEDFLADQALGQTISAPTDGEDSEVQIQIGFPEYLATTYRGYVDAQTALKLDLDLSGPALPTAASGEEFGYFFEMPNIIGLERDDNALVGPERIGDGIIFKCLQVSVAPTGMTATMPFSCLVRNQSSTNILA